MFAQIIDTHTHQFHGVQRTAPGFRIAGGMAGNAMETEIALNTGLIGKTYTMLSFNMPSIFGAYFSTGDFKAVILVAVLIVIDMLLYFPFMKMYEKQQLLIEQQDEMQE